MKLDINESSIIMAGVGTIIGMTVMTFVYMSAKNTKIGHMYQTIQSQQVEITKLQEQKASDLRLLRELRRQLKDNR